MHKQKDYYSLQTRTLSQAYANQVAIAIQNAQLYQRAHDAAAMEERNRLARELHDSVAQALYSISLFTDAINFPSGLKSKSISYPLNAPLKLSLSIFQVTLFNKNIFCFEPLLKRTKTFSSDSPCNAFTGTPLPNSAPSFLVLFFMLSRTKKLIRISHAQ
jgi:hypothetical protein